MAASPAVAMSRAALNRALVSGDRLPGRAAVSGEKAHEAGAPHGARLFVDRGHRTRVGEGVAGPVAPVALFR